MGPFNQFNRRTLFWYAESAPVRSAGYTPAGPAEIPGSSSMQVVAIPPRRMHRRANREEIVDPGIIEAVHQIRDWPAAMCIWQRTSSPLWAQRYGIVSILLPAPAPALRHADRVHGTVASSRDSIGGQSP